MIGALRLERREGKMNSKNKILSFFEGFFIFFNEMNTWYYTK